MLACGGIKLLAIKTWIQLASKQAAQTSPTLESGSEKIEKVLSIYYWCAMASIFFFFSTELMQSVTIYEWYHIQL